LKHAFLPVQGPAVRDQAVDRETSTGASGISGCTHEGSSTGKSRAGEFYAQRQRAIGGRGPRGRAVTGRAPSALRPFCFASMCSVFLDICPRNTWGPGRLVSQERRKTGTPAPEPGAFSVVDFRQNGLRLDPTARRPLVIVARQGPLINSVSPPTPTPLDVRDILVKPGGEHLFWLTFGVQSRPVTRAAACNLRGVQPFFGFSRRSRAASRQAANLLPGH